MAELDYWIWFSALPLRPASRRLLLDRLGGPREVFRATRRDLTGLSEREIAAVETRELERAGEILRRCGEEQVSILTLLDPAYPDRLSAIPDPPPLLYVKGRLPAVDLEPMLTVVGTRRCTPYGEKQARRLGYGFASAGAVVVTGLAGGVDSLAARGALLAGGRVVGVLGCAIDQVYPSFNRELYADVAAVGALVSEYPPGAEGRAAWFPQRDRIMAALSLATVVVEAPERSGALITAHRALDYGRDVFAVPGNVDSPSSQGCLRLLKEGAAVAAEPWDVLSVYEPQYPGKLSREGAKSPVPEPEPEPAPAAPEDKRGFFKLRERVRRSARPEPLRAQLEGLTETQLKLVGVMDRERMHLDDIVDLSGLPAATVTAELTMLVIKGCVLQSPGKRFTLNIKS